MQRLVETMMDEHRVIEAVLAALEAYAAAVTRGEDVRREDLGVFVRFMRHYADEQHHAKEEGLLFPAMQDHGFSDEAGPVAVMLHEHDVGRTHVARLAEIAAADAWPEDAADRIRVESAGLAQMLRAHIDKEDTILYPMATRAIPAPVFEALNARCDELEHEEATAGMKAELEELANELVARYV